MLGGRIGFEVVDISTTWVFSRYFIFLRDRKLAMLTQKSQKVSRSQVVHLLLIPAMSLVYLAKGLIDSLTDPLVFMVLTEDQAQTI